MLRNDIVSLRDDLPRLRKGHPLPKGNHRNFTFGLVAVALTTRGHDDKKSPTS